MREGLGREIPSALEIFPDLRRQPPLHFEKNEERARK